MSRISKRVREEAADLLLCAASLGEAPIMEAEAGQCEAAVRLAAEAWSVARFAGADEYIGYPWCYLEAAAILRDGWSPGDPVEVRRSRLPRARAVQR